MKMTSPSSPPNPYTVALGKRMSEVRERGASRAVLKKGAADINDLTVNPYVYKGFPEELRGNGYPTPAELAFRDAVCLYASLASGGRDVHSSEVGNLGSTLQRIAFARNSSPFDDSLAIRLHNDVVSSRGREALYRSVSSIVSTAVSFGAPVNFIRLAHDLRRAYASREQETGVSTAWSAAYTYVKGTKEDSES